MAAVATDSVFIRNQPLMKEGILPYVEADGTVVNRLKRWKDFKHNIGWKVPVIFEHPDKGNGRRGLYNGERMEGVAIIKQYKNKKILCFDAELRDDFKNADGFSAGYPFVKIFKSGKYGNEAYDEIQAAIDIDHVALTFFPREPIALQGAWDSTKGNVSYDSEENQDNTTKNHTDTSQDHKAEPKYAVAYDSVRPFMDLDSLLTRAELTQRIRNDNPDISTDRLQEMVEIQFKNQFKPRNINDFLKTNQDSQATDMSIEQVQKKELVESGNPADLVEEERKKKKRDGAGMGGDAMDDLLKQVASLKTSQDSLKTAVDSRIDKIIEVVSNLATTVQQDRQERAEARDAFEMNGIVNALKKVGYTATELDGLSKEELKGIMRGFRDASRQRTATKAAGSTDVHSDSYGIVAPGRFNIHNLVSQNYDSRRRVFCNPPGGAT